ncbi:hypothetical protein GALL_221110 [mine drainage metagenome]|uniref:Uncharacterized protein n=1 Tax=mine drainage metagenome TaxID=410659 RepID=A0A1J5RJC0_9ZZZZ
MPRGQQRGNKEAKKPKKDKSPPNAIMPLGGKAPVPALAPEPPKKK